MPYKDKEKDREYQRLWRLRNSRYNKDWRAENPEYHKKWAEDNADSKRLAVRRYQKKYLSIEENKTKKNARQRVRYAIRTGKLTKPAVCQECKVLKAIDAHHDDYSKALEVKWLCHGCHSLVHQVH